MGKFKSFFYIAFIAAAIFTGYFINKQYQKRQAVQTLEEAKIGAFEEKIPDLCERSEWIEFPAYENVGSTNDYQKNVILQDKGEDDDEKYADEDGNNFFVTAENYSLYFFVDRDVRVEGVLTGNQDSREIYVNKIKCVGPETNEAMRTERQNLMKYITANINTLALERSKDGSSWTVQTFYFYNDSDLYVQYESKTSFIGDSPYDSRLWLIRVSKLDREVPVIETLAYIQEDEDDSEKNIVRQGKDIYKDEENLTVYEFDPKENRWVLL